MKHFHSKGHIFTLPIFAFPDAKNFVVDFYFSFFIGSGKAIGTGFVLLRNKFYGKVAVWMRARLFFFFLMMLFAGMPAAAAESVSLGVVDPAQCIIGGIKPRECSMDYVEQVYGTNHKTEYANGPYGGQWVIYDYHDGRFVVHGFVRKDGSNIVIDVTTKDASMPTPAGVHVGMRLYQAFQVYGSVKQHRFSDGAIGYVYSANISDSLGLALIIDRNRVIQEITAWSSE